MVRIEVRISHSYFFFLLSSNLRPAGAKKRVVSEANTLTLFEPKREKAQLRILDTMLASSLRLRMQLRPVGAFLAVSSAQFVEVRLEIC